MIEIFVYYLFILCLWFSSSGKKFGAGDEKDTKRKLKLLDYCRLHEN